MLDAHEVFHGRFGRNHERGGVANTKDLSPALDIQRMTDVILDSVLVGKLLNLVEKAMEVLAPASARFQSSRDEVTSLGGEGTGILLGLGVLGLK